MFSSLLQKIPILIAGILLLVALLTIYFRSKNVTKSEFVKILKNTKYLSVGVLIFVFILAGTFGFFNHFKAKQSVMAVVSLNYSEASLAQNSNGTRYNMSEIICDEVVEKAIKMGAFENVTVKQLKNCLSVYPYVQGDVDDKANYHISTEFVVEYHASKHTEHLDSENVIMLITSAYKEYYIEKYTDNFSLATQKEKPNFADMEYMDIVTYFNKETTAVLNYLYGMPGWPHGCGPWSLPSLPRPSPCARPGTPCWIKRPPWPTTCPWATPLTYVRFAGGNIPRAVSRFLQKDSGHSVGSYG